MKQYKNMAGKFFTSFFVAAICAATVACSQDDSNGTSRFAGIWMMDEVVESQKNDPDIETINVYRIKDDGSIVRLGIEKKDNMQWGQVNSQGRVKLSDDLVKMIEDKGGKLPERLDFRLRNDGKLEMLDGDSNNGTPHVLINEAELAELRAEFKQLRVA